MAAGDRCCSSAFSAGRKDTAWDRIFSMRTIREILNLYFIYIIVIILKWK